MNKLVKYLDVHLQSQSLPVYKAAQNHFRGREGIFVEFCMIVSVCIDASIFEI